MAGLFLDFEAIGAAAACRRERGRRDAVDVAVRASTRLVSDRRPCRECRSAQVQPHFKKCFEAIDQVKFEPLEDVSELAITQMISPEKEVVPMMTPVLTQRRK